MGQKANRFIAAAGVIVLGITGAAQFANGVQTLWGPPGLPECESADASDLVRQIIADNFEVQLDRLNEVAQNSFDDAAQTRTCTAVIEAVAEGNFEIGFELSWHDREERMVAAEVEVLRQL